MYLNNNSKFSDEDRNASFNISNKNTIENFTQVINWEATSWLENWYYYKYYVMMDKVIMVMNINIMLKDIWK